MLRLPGRAGRCGRPAPRNARPGGVDDKMTLSAHIRADDLLALDALQRALGDRVVSDTATRGYYANDVFWQPGIPPLAVALPESVEEAAQAVRLATDAGLSIVPRGGGMSYSKGYLPDRADSVVVDTRKLNRV